MKLPMTTFTPNFTYYTDTAISEASDFRFHGCCERIFDDAYDIGLRFKMRDGAVVDWALHNKEMRDGELIAWNFIPASEQDRRLAGSIKKVTIFND